MESRIQSSFLIFLLFSTIGTASILNHAFCFESPNSFFISMVFLIIFNASKQFSFTISNSLKTFYILIIFTVTYLLLLLFNITEFHQLISTTIKPFSFITVFQITEIIFCISAIKIMKASFSKRIIHLLCTLFILSNSLIIYSNLTDQAVIIKLPLFTFSLSIAFVPLLIALRHLFYNDNLLTGVSCFLLVNLFCTTFLLFSFTKPYTATGYLLKSIFWFSLYRTIIIAASKIDHTDFKNHLTNNKDFKNQQIQFTNSDSNLDFIRSALTEIHSEHQYNTLLPLIVKKAVYITDANEGELEIIDKKNLCIEKKVHFVQIPYSSGCTYNYEKVINTAIYSKEILISCISPATGKGPDCYAITVPLLNLNSLTGVIIVSKFINFSDSSFFYLDCLASHAVIAMNNARQLECAMRQAQTDSLTGLCNHRHFYYLAKKEIYRAQRYQHPLTVLMFDIDHFKLVNDTYGHTAGDQVLITVSNLCRKLFRNIDIICRYGGEEFAVLLPETPVETAKEVAERLRYTIQKTQISYHRCHITVTISLGIAPLRNDCTSITRLIERADTALYHAKIDGRNRIIEWKASMCHISSIKYPKILPENINKTFIK